MTQEYGAHQSRAEDGQRETISVGDHQFNMPGRTRGLLYTSLQEPIDHPLALRDQIGLSYKGFGPDMAPEDMSVKSPAEPSTIYLKMPISRPTNSNAVPAPEYCSTYAELSPDQKWIYLDWLSDVSQKIDIEYVSLYYYGLERQLVEGEFDLAFDEVLFLRESHEHPSFLSYSSLALLAACALRKRADRLADAYQSAGRHLSTDLGLQFAHMLGLDLTARDLIELARAIAGVNRRYIDTERETFESVLSQSLAKKYGDAHFPFAARYAIEALPKRRTIAFANVSLPADIRERELPSFLEYQPLLAEVRGLLSEAHKEVQVILRERHKSEPKQGASTETESSRTQAGFLPVTCPYCAATLDIEPEREQKCPVCGKTMYAKKLPSQESKRFVTEKEAGEMEAASEQHQRQEPIAEIEVGIEQQQRQKRIARLEEQVKDAQKRSDSYQESTSRAQLEGELGDNAKAWGHFNQAYIDVMGNPQSGLYRNAKFEMAMLAERERQYTVQAQLLSEVAYLDYCRYTSIPTGGNGRPLGRRPPFDAYITPDVGMPDFGPDSPFAPGVLGAIQAAMKEGQIDFQALRKIFMSVTQQIHQSVKHPCRPEDAWTALEKALSYQSSEAK